MKIIYKLIIYAPIILALLGGYVLFSGGFDQTVRNSTLLIHLFYDLHIVWCIFILGFMLAVGAMAFAKGAFEKFIVAIGLLINVFAVLGMLLVSGGASH